MSTEIKMFEAWRELVNITSALNRMFDLAPVERTAMKSEAARHARKAQVLAGEFAKELEEETDGS